MKNKRKNLILKMFFLMILVFCFGIFKAKNTEAVCPGTYPDGMIYCEDFEDDNELDTYPTTNYLDYYNLFVDHTNLTTVDCIGNSCLRGNLGNNGVPDKITGETGTVDPHASFGLGETTYGPNNLDLYSEVGDELYLSWQHKFDEREVANLPTGTMHKILYAFEDNPAGYFIFKAYPPNELKLEVNGDGVAGFPYTAGDYREYGCSGLVTQLECENNARCIWRNGAVPETQGCLYSYQYGYDIDVDSLGIDVDDGDWHKYSIWINYGDQQTNNGKIKFWVDDNLLLDVDDAWIINRENERMTSIGLPSNWNAYSNVMDSLGWQVDDIQIWDRVPVAILDTTPPSAPSGLSVS